jgi:hypothetical protein
VTTVDVEVYLRRLVADIATAPAIGTSVRHDLLIDVLAPMGAAAAGRAAGEIEAHAYWVRYGTYASGEDVALSASVAEAVYLVGRALDDEAVSELTDAA